MSHLIDFEPATGDPDRYDMEVLTQRLDPQRSYFMIRVRACREATLEVPEECGSWSQYSEPFYVPEAPQMLGLPILLLALVALRWRKEILRQLRDQPLHVLMNTASVAAIASLLFWLGVRSFWAVVVAEGHFPTDLQLASMILGILGTATWNIAREWHQWPSSRWWDPPLDWFFEAGGIALGAVCFWLWISPFLV